MKNFCFACCIGVIVYSNHAFGSEAGMPQLNPEFWISQIFWLVLIFSFLYLVISKIFIPKITYSIENRKSRIVNDLNVAQKLKENAEQKLNEYNKIIESSKKEAQKIIDDSRKKLGQDIEFKKKAFNDEIEKELLSIEKEIFDLKKNSIPSIKKIAIDISAEVIKKIMNSEINKSNVSAVVDDMLKRKVKKHT